MYSLYENYGSLKHWDLPDPRIADSKHSDFRYFGDTLCARTRARDPTESSAEGRLRVGDEPKSRGKFYRIFRARVFRLTNARSVRTKKMEMGKDEETRALGYTRTG